MFVVHLTVDQLTTIIEETVQKKLKEILPPPPIKYLTTKEAAAFLRVSRSTLANYHKQGLLRRTLIGSKKLYVESEVKAALVTIQKYKSVA